jgi:uncharacterized membrane protein
MIRFPTLSALLAAAFCTLATQPALAEQFKRPIPAAQSATVELWFALATLAFAASLVLVQWLVSRR